MRPSLLFALLIAVSFAAQGQQQSLAPLQFLIGAWEAEPQPGGGSGHSTFASDLQGKVIVRTNHAEYPPAEGRPAMVHDDLMIIYAEASGSLQADYYDSEGHVIRYGVAASAPGSAVFLSEPAPGAPRYRLTYDAAPDGRVSGRFEIAPPGKPEEFSTYLQWFMRRPAAAHP